MKVQLFIPCFVDQFYPSIGMNTVKILEKVGCEVLFNENQTCCGQSAFQAGFTNEAQAVCTKFLKDFSGEEVIVAPTGNCVGFIRSQFTQLFQDGLHKEDAQRVKQNIYELSEFLLEVIKRDDLGASLDATVTYHDACGALHDANIKEGPRKLLRKVKNLTLLENQASEICCGFGGAFAKNFEPIAEGMAHTKVQAAIQTKADYIVSTDVTCLMHLDAYLKKRDDQLKTMHLAEVLAQF